MHEERASSRLAVVVLNYRTPTLVIDCLGSLEGEVATDAGACVVVVDNDSGDGSADCIEAAISAQGWSRWATVVRSTRNGGFAAGNNIGIAAVHAQRYLLLNSDTVVRPGALAVLERVLDEVPGVGAVGPRLEDRDGRPQASCFRFRRPVTELVEAAATGPLDRLLRRGVVVLDKAPHTRLEPDWISYACVLLTREAIERVGPIDEGYFMYYEDLDHCRRMRREGLRIVFEPEARVVHLEGESSGVRDSGRRRRPAFFYASRDRYYRRFHGRFGPLRANVCWLFGRGIALIREFVGRRPVRARRSEWRDIWIRCEAEPEVLGRPFR